MYLFNALLELDDELDLLKLLEEDDELLLDDIQLEELEDELDELLEFILLLDELEDDELLLPSPNVIS